MASPKAQQPSVPGSPSPDAHDQIQADVHALLTDMTATFRSFSETIFSKIDVMQEKLAALDASVADLTPASRASAPPTEAVSAEDPPEPHPEPTLESSAARSAEPSTKPPAALSS